MTTILSNSQANAYPIEQWATFALTRQAMASITIAELETIEPRLAEYLNAKIIEAQQEHDQYQGFCCFQFWHRCSYDFWPLVGYRADRFELRFCRANEVARRYLWENLPLCKGRCFAHRRRLTTKSRNAALPLARPYCGEDGKPDNRCLLHRQPNADDLNSSPTGAARMIVKAERISVPIIPTIGARRLALATSA